MLRPERQFLQVGAETIGANKIEADIEIINIAYRSLSMIGIKNIRRLDGLIYFHGSQLLQVMNTR